MIRLTNIDDEMHDKHLLETGVECAYDGEPIEYTDLVVVLLMVKPFIVEGQLRFYDVCTTDNKDYLYEPSIFHGKNWDTIEEELETQVRDHKPLEVEGAIVYCKYCKSGILPGETTGVGLLGEIHRSERNPDLGAFCNQLEKLDVAPIVICISCMLLLNTDVQEIWSDGVCHDNECRQGTEVRCWRSGCPGNCQLKQDEDIAKELEEAE